ncbi:MAG: hypothetical protein QXM96_00540 [Candidatus Woesearchaeota archaeon]
MSDGSGEKKDDSPKMFNPLNYYYFNTLISTLEDITKKKHNSEKLEDRLAILEEFSHPDKDHKAKLQLDLRNAFLHDEDSVYRAAVNVLGQKLKKDTDKFGEGADDENLWAVIDAFVEASLSKLYHVDIEALKRDVAETYLSSADRKNDKELKKRLRMLFDDALGGGKLGEQSEQFQGITTEEIYRLLAGKTKTQAQLYLSEVVGRVASAHATILQNLFFQKLLGDKQHELRQKVYERAKEKGYETRVPWAERGLGQLIDSYLLTHDELKEKLGLTPDKLGYYILEKKKETKH